LEEAVAGLVAAFADCSGAETTDPVPFALDPADDDELLVQLLEEVLYLVDALGVVPATTEVVEAEDGGIAGSFDVVPVAQIEQTGAVPKAISRGDLSFARGTDDRWACRFTVDV
jgi:SHS2 domain-containing protein